MTLQANLAFLAAAVREGSGAGPGGAAGLDDLADLAGLEPADLARFARRHKVAEMLDAFLDGSPLRARLTAGVLADLRDQRLAQAARSEHLLVQLARVTGAFRRGGLDCIVLKGHGLAARFYGGLDRRATRDLDLLVRRSDLAAAEGVLADLGFRRASWAPLRGLATRVTHAFEYAAGGDDAVVDLHWTFARHPSYRFDLDGMFRRRMPQAIGPVVVHQLADEDTLAFALVSVLKDLGRGGLRARALVDVHRICLACGPRLDWPGFLDRRAEEGTHAIAVNVLALMLEALAARATLPQVADAVERERARTGVRVYIDAAVARRVLAPPTLALANRALATRLYDCSAARSLAWWLASFPVRVLACRGWRVARRGRVPQARPSVAAADPAGQGRPPTSLP